MPSAETVTTDYLLQKSLLQSFLFRKKSLFLCCWYKSIQVKELLSTLQNVTFRQKQFPALPCQSVDLKGDTETKWKNKELLFQTRVIYEEFTSLLLGLPDKKADFQPKTMT